MANNDHNTRWPSPSVTSVPEYQLSGLPFCKTKSIGDDATDTFIFPRVTRWITISSSAEVDIFFTDDDGNNAPVASQYFTVPANTHILRLELRCAKIWVKNSSGGAADVSVIAGLTHVDSSKSVPESMLDWS